MYCEFKVCLGNILNFDCECLFVDDCNFNIRKRWLLLDFVVYCVIMGFYYFVRGEKEIDDNGM